METPEEQIEVHVLMVAHLLVEVAEAGTTSYSLSAQGGCESQRRSEVAVGATISYCPAPHTVRGLQTVSEVSVQSAVRYSVDEHLRQAVHTVFCVERQGEDTKLCPATH